MNSNKLFHAAFIFEKVLGEGIKYKRYFFLFLIQILF